MTIHTDPPTPPEGYTLCRQVVGGESGKVANFTPQIPADAFKTLLVWNHWMKKWEKPLYITSSVDAWLAFKEQTYHDPDDIDDWLKNVSDDNFGDLMEFAEDFVAEFTAEQAEEWLVRFYQRLNSDPSHFHSTPAQTALIVLICSGTIRHVEQEGATKQAIKIIVEDRMKS